MMNYDNEINEVLKLSGVQLLGEEYINNSAELSYIMYREIYKKMGSNKYFFETRSSHLAGMKQYLKELKEEYPNSLNIPHYDPNKKITYWERIAGFYHPETGELDDDIKHQAIHQDTDEHLENGWVRFYIFDNNHNRYCFISAMEEETTKKGYKFLKSHYKSLGIHYFQIDWLNGDITYNDEGKKIKYDDLYEFFVKYLLNSNILYENSIYNRIKK